MSDKMTRVSGDLYEDAERTGNEEMRSTRQQIEYWARVGQAITAQGSSHSKRVRDALAGTLASEKLTYEESAAFDAQVEARLHARLASTDLSLPENQSVQPISKLSRTPSGDLLLTIPLAQDRRTTDS